MALSWFATIWNWIKLNTPWIFSGCGVAIIIAIAGSHGSPVINAGQNVQYAEVAPGGINIQIIGELSRKFGVTEEQMKAIVRQVITELGQDNEKTTVPSSVIIGVLTSMGEPVRKWDQQTIINTLIQKGADYRNIVAQLKTFQSDDNEVKQLQMRAKDALGAGHFEEAESLLKSARDKDLEAIRSQEKNLRSRKISAAESCTAAASAASLQANQAGYKKAAQYFGQAAELYLNISATASLLCKFEQGQILLDLGHDFGDMESLYSAVDVYNSLLSTIQADTRPELWADIQNHLGEIHSLIGEREGSNKHILKAIKAHKSALALIPMDTHPHEWATTQASLGNALFIVGRGERSTENLEAAASAYRASLNALSGDKNSFEWAGVHNNFGGVLLAIGERERGTTHLDQAVTAFQTALKIRTRERAPVAWAESQNNLGTALMAIGERKKKS